MLEPLYEYSWFMQKIRLYLDEGRSRDEAVTLAVRDCIRDGIFADFAKKRGSEVENMLFIQFNMDDALAMRYEEGVEDVVKHFCTKDTEVVFQFLRNNSD